MAQFEIDCRLTGSLADSHRLLYACQKATEGIGEMPKSDNSEPDDGVRESAYRRGYTHGVEAVLMLIESKLTLSDRGKLGTWRNQLLQWRGPLGMQEINSEPPHPPALDSLQDANRT